MKKWYEEKAFLEMQYILDEDLNMNMEQYIQKEMDKNLKIGRYVLM